MRFTFPWSIPTRLLGEITWQICRVERSITALTERIKAMSVDLQALKDAVAANTAVDQSAITLLTGLTAKIQELINASGPTVDPAELQAIVDTINADNASLGAAVAANTQP